MRSLAATFAVTLALLAIPAAAAAGAPNPLNRARLDSTIRYLQEAQNPDGGFGGDSGRESGQGFSAWVALALAAAGVNPRCQARPGGADAFDFLAAHFQRGLEEEIAWPRVPTTALERELMVVNASGADPHAFAGHDLVAELLARVSQDDGSFPYVPGGQGEVNDTIFAIIALAPLREAAAQAAIQPAVDWLIAEQNGDGGWAWRARGDASEADLTGAAIQALRAAGRPDTEAERRGLAYLHRAQNPDGGFPEFAGEAESNVASTAWATQGIWAAGGDPETWTAERGGEPLSYLASLQQPDGHLRWKASQDLNGIWMTAYAAPAFAGQTWPIPSSPCTEPPPSPPRPGQGEGTQSGRGTIAGGGGAGAPLFSRPKPQSKGRTPGGVRVRRDQPGRARDHSGTRRGENAHQPTGTASAEPTGREASAGGESAALAAGAGSPSSGGGGSLAGGDSPPREDAAGTGSGDGGPTVAGFGQRAGHQSGNRGREVSGALVGAGAASPRAGALAFGAPGLHSAGADSGSPWPAIAIGAAAALLVLLGSQLDRWRGGVYA